MIHFLFCLQHYAEMGIVFAVCWRMCEKFYAMIRLGVPKKNEWRDLGIAMHPFFFLYFNSSLKFIFVLQISLLNPIRIRNDGWRNKIMRAIFFSQFCFAFAFVLAVCNKKFEWTKRTKRAIVYMWMRKLAQWHCCHTDSAHSAERTPKKLIALYLYLYHLKLSARKTYNITRETVVLPGIDLAWFLFLHFAYNFCVVRLLLSSIRFHGNLL